MDDPVEADLIARSDVAGKPQSLLVPAIPVMIFSESMMGLYRLLVP